MCACNMKMNQPLCSPKLESCGMVSKNDVMVIPPSSTIKEKGACPIELCDPNKSDFIMRVQKRSESANGMTKNQIEFDVFTPHKPQIILEFEEKETQWDDNDALAALLIGGKGKGKGKGKEKGKEKGKGGKSGGGKGGGKKGGKKGK